MNINNNELLSLVLKKLRLEFKGCKVGFFAENKYDGGTSVPMVALYNDKGTKKIPQREFMLPATDKVAAKVMRILIQDIAKGIHEKQAMQRAAILMRDSIIKEIHNMKEPPNAKSTIKNKGFNNPLFDTGRMRNSVTYKI